MSLSSLRRRRRVDRRLYWTVLVLVMVIGAVKLCGPLATNHRQQGELAALRSEKAALAAEHRRLQKHKVRLASNVGMEAAVRAEGYVREGERRLVFIPKRQSSLPTPSDSTQP